MKQSKRSKDMIRSTLVLLAVSLSVGFNTDIQANETNPIVNPIDPTKKIFPEVDNDQSTQITQELPQSDIIENSDQTAETPTHVAPDSDLMKSYLPKITESKKKKHTDQITSPIALTTYHFDIDGAGGGAPPAESATGEMMAALSGSLLFGR